MDRSNRFVNKILGVVALIAGCAIGLVGVLIVILGLLGGIQGMHGGVLAASVMLIFGIGLSFVGFYGARYGYRVVYKHERPTVVDNNIAT
jgi:hypothetical protein